MIKLFHKLSDGLDRLCKLLVIMSIVTLILVMFLQILKRAILGSAISWADGMARYMLIWSTFLGATVATKEASHISLTFIQDKLSGKAREIFDCVIILCSIILCVAVVYTGFKVIQLVLPQKSDSLPISVAWIYAAIPFSEIVMTIHLIDSFLEKTANLMRKKAGDTAL